MLKRRVWSRYVSRLITCAFALLATPGLAAVADRSVSGTVVHSPHDPAYDIRLPSDVTYAGSDKFLISKPDTANECQMFAFAKNGANGRLSRVYWVHFERILPSFPKARMHYESPGRATIGGHEFFVDTDVSDEVDTPAPGSDDDHFDNLLAAHGFKRRPMMYVRFVQLLDAAKRKELMIIVGEALPPGLTAASLAKGGAAHGRWPAMKRALIASAARSISITPASATLH